MEVFEFPSWKATLQMLVCIGLGAYIIWAVSLPTTTGGPFWHAVGLAVAVACFVIAIRTPWNPHRITVGGGRVVVKNFVGGSRTWDLADLDLSNSKSIRWRGSAAIRLKDGRKAFRVGTDFPRWQQLLECLAGRALGDEGNDAGRS